jgi:ribose transport system substrate-binding protein
MIKSLVGGIVAASAFVMLSSSAIADPEIVKGPAAEPDCFAPWAADTQFFKFPKKDGPSGSRSPMALRQHLAHQMIRPPAYAAQKDVGQAEEFKVISAGEVSSADLGDRASSIQLTRSSSTHRTRPLSRRSSSAPGSGRRLVAFDIRHQGRHQRQCRSEALARLGQMAGQPLPDGGKIRSARRCRRRSMLTHSIHEVLDASGRNGTSPGRQQVG